MDVFLPKGTRDHLPAGLATRTAVLRRIETVFGRHGFMALDTPAFERIETLEGKYGEEGKKLIFRILERGEGASSGKADLALRYDLTVPLARVIAMHPEIRMPFRRWQIAPVWRADRPAKGRFREFLQCDCDVVGAPQGLADAECLSVAHEALVDLGFDGFVIRLNDRRLLRAVSHAVGCADREAELLLVVDKLDKVGRSGVEAELDARGFPVGTGAALWALTDLGSSEMSAVRTLGERLVAMGTPHLADVKAAVAGLVQLGQDALALGIPAHRLAFDSTLARGLDYYTGPVWEIVVESPKIGTIASGGRYDGLIGMFSGRSVPAVGVSLGLERLLVVLEEWGKLPTVAVGPTVVVAIAEDRARDTALRLTAALRTAGIRVDLAAAGRLKAQFKYADDVGAKAVVVLGGDEVDTDTLTLKSLAEGTQQRLTWPEGIARLRAM